MLVESLGKTTTFSSIVAGLSVTLILAESVMLFCANSAVLHIIAISTVLESVSMSLPLLKTWLIIAPFLNISRYL